MDIVKTPIPSHLIHPLLNEGEIALLSCIMHRGHLKPNPPPVLYQHTFVGNTGRRIKQPIPPTGEASFLWALVAYETSPYKKHLAVLPDARLFFSDKSQFTEQRTREIAQIVVGAIDEKYHYGKRTRFF